MKKIFAVFLAVCVTLPAIVSAERLDTIGVEMNDLTANTEFSLNGIFSTAADGATTTNPHSGNYALKFNEQGAAQFSWMAYKYRSAATAASTTVRAYIYLNQTFGAAQEIFTLANETPGSLYSLRLNASNQLCMFDSVPNQIGSCTAITTGTYHYVELATDGASTEIGRLDGVTFAQSNAVTGGAISRVYFGCAFAASCKSDTWYDDIAINDSTGSNQTFFPGAGNELLFFPSAAGDANTWHQGTGKFPIGTTNNFNFVNNFPIATGQTGRWLVASTTVANDFYAVVASSTVPAGSTINTVQVLSRHARGAATPGAFKVQIKKTTGGTIAQGTAVTPVAATSTNAAAAPFNPQLTQDLDPDGSAWTATTIASMQIGAADTTAGAGAIHLSGVYAYVDYVPGAVTPTVAPNLAPIFDYFFWWL